MTSTFCTLSPGLRRFSMRALCVIGLLGASLVAHAQSALLYGYDAISPKRIVSFSADAPATLLTSVTLTGLGANDVLLGIDIRPATGELYGIATSDYAFGRLVKIDVQSGAVTNVGGGAFRLNGQFFGVSFNSASDRIRLISNFDSNIQVNPVDGLLSSTDTALAYATGDPQFGVNPAVSHLAYGSASSGATATVYGIDVAAGNLVRIGGIDGVPSASAGQLTTIGSLGVTFAGGSFGNIGGFDIDSGTNTAYAALRTSAGSVLHTINLATGVATPLGLIGTGSSAIDGLAIAPPNACLDIDGDGTVRALTDGLMLVRALLGMTGTAVTNNALPSPAPPRATWALIRTHMNAKCGMDFRP